ncbi:MAG TPA: nitroreductase/quinone reductase family protein [Acidimicrobiales bacterium]|nr:nitroreductase/quinone reductase family protein [Acidimicrobiales bacterium]
MPDWDGEDLTGWNSKPLLHVATTGRRTGERRKKWWLVFAVLPEVIYLIEERGTRADWVRNIIAEPRVKIRVDGGEELDARARVVTEPYEAERAKGAVRGTDIGRTLADLIEWGQPVAIEPARAESARATGGTTPA